MPIGVSVAGLLTVGLAATSVSNVDARKPRLRPTRISTGPPKGKTAPDFDHEPTDVTHGADGSFTYGNKSPTRTVIVNKGYCVSKSDAAAWASSMDAFGKAMVKAVAYVCHKDVHKMPEYLHGQLNAHAYAATWTATYAECKTKGAAVGCAASAAHAKAQARAAYDAWVKAYAVADKPDRCGCVHEVWAEAESTIEAWGKIFANAQGAVKSKVCNKSKVLSEHKRTGIALDCYGTASANLWGQAIAKAWVHGNCGATDGYADAECGAECGTNLKCNDECKDRAWGKAKADVQTYLNVDIANDDNCATVYKIGVGSKVIEDKTGTASGVKPGSIYGPQWSRCIAKAQTDSLSHSVSVFLGTFADAMLNRCKYGYDDDGGRFEKATAKAVAKIYISVLAKCNQSGEGTLGCAFSYATTEAIANACAKGWAAAWAKAKIGAKSNCNCHAEAKAQAVISTFFKADLWAKALAQAEAGLYDANGDYCIKGSTNGWVQESVYADCVASASVKLIQQAFADAYVSGKCHGNPAKCEECAEKGECSYDECAKDIALYADSYVSVFQKAIIDEQPGYCTGKKEGHYTYLHLDLDGGVTVKAGGPLSQQDSLVTSDD